MGNSVDSGQGMVLLSVGLAERTLVVAVGGRLGLNAWLEHSRYALPHGHPDVLIRGPWTVMEHPLGWTLPEQNGRMDGLEDV